MKIGILSKRTTLLTGRMIEYFENKGHKVFCFSTENLEINESLLNYDFFILKSKRLFYFYAGFYLEAHNIPVIPNTSISYQIKNRVDSYVLIKEAGLLQPNYYLGTFEALKKNLTKDFFPLIQKPLFGSGSRGVKVINTMDDLERGKDDIIYIQQFIEGTHYNLYFIEDKMCLLEKPPLSNEHIKMKPVTLTDEFKQIAIKWKNTHNLLFGHLDLVKEYNTGKIYVVDPGSFPVFTNWTPDADPTPKICNIILKEYERLKASK
ncbi:MAG: ATP-grasp domain-containing protein [Promethearchaeota archaeon]